jgi:vacuolar-type H+-ATPase subunit I/STV1
LDLLPGIWMLLYGCGALAMSFFAPLSILVLGVAFVVAGMIALLFFPGREVLTMALGFGGIHLAYGLAVSLTRTSERSAQLAEVEFSSL